MDERGAVHGNGGDEAALHQIDEHGAEADFDDVATDAPEDGDALFARAVDGGEQMAQIARGEKIGKRIEKVRERRSSGRRLGEFADAYFTLARGQWVGFYAAEG